MFCEQCSKEVRFLIEEVKGDADMLLKGFRWICEDHGPQVEGRESLEEQTEVSSVEYGAKEPGQE